MSTTNISLLAELEKFVDAQVERGYSTSNEYVRELIQKIKISFASVNFCGTAPVRRQRDRQMQSTSRGSVDCRAQSGPAVRGGNGEIAVPRKFASRAVDDNIAHYLSEAVIALH
jgi:hypothetical protein